MKEIIVKHTVLLRWWLIFTLITIGSVGLYTSGILQQIVDVDFTKISFLIFGLFYMFSIKNGIDTYKANKDKTNVDELCKKNEAGWFISDQLLNLGMVGTVVGLIYVLISCFSGIDVSNVATMKRALTLMSSGMGTALYTTASGLICSILLKVQLFNLSQYLDRLSDKDCRLRDI